MAAQTIRNHKTASESTDIRPDGRGLYFNNNGLFSENYLLNRLPSEDKDSYILEHWETEPLPEFSECYEWMLGTWAEFKDVFPSLNEAQLEDKWIRPILKKLGWSYEVQDRLKKRGKTQIPDYSLFSDDSSYFQAKDAKNDDAYFQHALAVADAKGMGVNLDGNGRTNSNPSYQIVRYMEDTGKVWGILTDGEYWRLYSLNSESKFTTFYEVNIRKALAKRNDERFKYFFNFFRKEAFVKNPTSGVSFLDVVYRNGEQYAHEVETQLRDRAFRITQAICRGLASNYSDVSGDSLNEIYRHGLFYLFRMMFILNAEAKSIFDVNDTSDYYPASLRSLAIELKKDFELGRKWSNQSKSYDHINRLMDTLSKGDKSIGVFTLGFEIFSSGMKNYFKEKSIPDSILNPAILELACSHDEQGDLKFIDYKRLSPDHLGSLFEGLLEYKLVLANEKLIVENGERNSWRDVPESKRFKLKEFIVEKGELYLESGSGDRKSTGSYYTPSYIVDKLLEDTLQPLCEDKSVDEILKIKLCDPAMGSGHFLLGAIKFLEERILDSSHGNEKTLEFDREEIRWRVLHNCIHGVDMNPLAVELAKYSLWMYTIRPNFELEPLADQLICGNSLIPKSADNSKPFVWEKAFSDVFSSGGFDAIVGNPPYLSSKAIKAEDGVEYKKHFTVAKDQYDLFELFIELATRIVKKSEGAFGFVVPDTSLFLDSYKTSRALLFPHLVAVKHWGDGHFQDASVAVATPVCRMNTKSKYISITRSPDGIDEQEDILKGKLDGKLFLGMSSSLVDFENKMSAWKTLSKLAQINRGEEISKKNLKDEDKKGNVRCLVASDISDIDPEIPVNYYIPKTQIKKTKLHTGLRVVSQRIRNPSLKRRIIARLIDDDRVSIANVAVTRMNDATHNYLVLAIYNSRLMNYYFKNKYVDVNVNEAKLKDIPVPDFEKKNALVSKIVSQVKKESLGVFHNDQLNALIYDLYEVPVSVQKKVEQYYASIEDAEIDEADDDAA